MDILEEITAHKKIEVAHFKEALPECDIHEEVEQLIESCPAVPGGSMRQALMQSASGIISEFKRKSPSKGWICENGRADEIPAAYQRNGAAALSILTDEHYFGGKDAFITTARNSGVTIPVLYKNFVIDEYQLFQARLCGASAVLVIAACMEKGPAQARQLFATARELGLEVLLEMHSEEELAFAELEPDMYGINNRNLGTFVTDVNNSFRLAQKLPAEGCKVSESGISNPETVKELRQCGYNGFLIGENFMKTSDPGKALAEFGQLTIDN